MAKEPTKLENNVGDLLYKIQLKTCTRVNHEWKLDYQNYNVIKTLKFTGLKTDYSKVVLQHLRLAPCSFLHSSLVFWYSVGEGEDASSLQLSSPLLTGVGASLTFSESLSCSMDVPSVSSSSGSAQAIKLVGGPVLTPTSPA